MERSEDPALEGGGLKGGKDAPAGDAVVNTAAYVSSISPFCIELR